MKKPVNPPVSADAKVSPADSTQKITANFLLIDKKVFFYVLILVGVYLTINLYRSVISSLVVGILLAYLLQPIENFLTSKLRIKSRVSAWIVFLTFISLIITITRLGAPILFNQIRILTDDFEVISNEVIALQPRLDELTDIDIPLKEIIPELENEIQQFLVPNRLFRMLLSATSNIVWVMVTLMTCFYLLMDHSKIIKWIIQLAPDSARDSVADLLAEINMVWKTYLRGQFSMMLLIGFLSGLGGVAVGLRNALIIGVIAGILELIPSLGPTIATFIAGMSAWTQGSLTLDISNFWFAIIVSAIFIFIQILENTILIPRIMGKRMKIHPAFVFIAIVSTLSLFGVLAGLIVIPVIGSIAVIFQYSYQHLNRPDGDYFEG